MFQVKRRVLFRLHWLHGLWRMRLIEVFLLLPCPSLCLLRCMSLRFIGLMQCVVGLLILFLLLLILKLNASSLRLPLPGAQYMVGIYCRHCIFLVLLYGPFLLLILSFSRIHVLRFKGGQTGQAKKTAKHYCIQLHKRSFVKKYYT